MRITLSVVVMLIAATPLAANPPRSLPLGQKLDDARLGKLRTLDDYFPMTPVADAAAWPARRDEVRRRILFAAGLTPMPTRTPLNAVVHGRVERDDYTVDRVIFESMPGHYVTGSLYRPRAPLADGKKRPAVLNPHGHWPEGRFADLGEKAVRSEIADGAERFEVGGRHPKVARCVQLARMGCVAFIYDMEGYADSVQFPHRAGVRPDDASQPGYLFFSPRAELRQQNMLGLQTWNSIRALDFVLSLDEVDPARIAVTGASGGGTQTMILAAIDDRIAAAFPAVMVSTAMQGGCTCENAAHLRINQGNIDIAAAAAPRPLGLVAADDWTKELETKGHPDLKSLYAMLNHADRYEAHFHLQFKHNYNAVNRSHLYGFINRHFALGFEEPIIERDYQPLSRDEASVWTGDHAKPTGDAVGETHERKLLKWWADDADARLAAMSDDERRKLVTESLGIIIGRSPAAIGPVEWTMTEKRDHGDHLLMTGALTVTQHHEQLPAVFLYPKENRSGQVVVWLTDTGKAGLLDDAGKPTPAVAKLIAAGHTVASIDLLGQGEFTDDGKPITSASVGGYGDGKQPWQKAACYTFGYNPSLFAQRCRDLHSLVAMIRSDDKHEPVKAIHLVAIGEQVGPVALAARSQLADAIARTAVDTRGFSFDSVDRFDHPMFVPGIERIGGVDGLRFACQPHAVHEVAGPDAATTAIVSPDPQ